MYKFKCSPSHFSSPAPLQNSGLSGEKAHCSRDEYTWTQSPRGPISSLVHGGWFPSPFPFPPYHIGVFSNLRARSFPFCLPQASRWSVVLLLVGLAFVTVRMGSLGISLGRKFLTGAVGDVISHREAKPASVRESEV